MSHLMTTLGQNLARHEMMVTRYSTVDKKIQAQTINCDKIQESNARQDGNHVLAHSAKQTTQPS